MATKFAALIVWLALVAYASAQVRPMVGPQTVISGSASSVPLTVKAASSQTTDVLQIQSAAGVRVAGLGANGSIQGLLEVATPPTNSSLVFAAKTTGLLTPIALATVDSVNNRIGFFTTSPTAPFQVSAVSRFSGQINIDDLGLGTFALGLPPVGMPIGDYNWNLAVARLGTIQREVGSATPGSANQWGLAVFAHVNKTTSGAGYEKAGLFAYAESVDGSDYGAGINRDVTGADLRGTILGGTSNGRAWGLATMATAIAGSDGQLIGGEFDLNNGGSDQAEVDQTTSKAGVTVVSLGANPGTMGVAILASAAGNKWHKGLWARQSSLTDSFVELYKTAANTHLFKIRPTGQTLIGDLANDSSLNNYDPTVYGQLGVAGYASILGDGGTVTSEKHALYLFSSTGSSKHRIGTTRYDSGVAFWPLAFETGNAGTGLAQEVLLLTLDPFVQFTTSFTGATPKSAASTVALRNNAGSLEVSENNGAWAHVTSGGGSLTGSGTSGFVTKWTGTTSIGNSDCQDTGTIFACAIPQNSASYIQITNTTSGTAGQAAMAAIASNSVTTLMGATSPGFTTANGIPANAGYISSSAASTNGLYLQSLADSVHIFPGTAEAARFNTTGQFYLGGTSTDLSLGSVPTIVTFGSTAGFDAVTATTNASFMGMAISSGNYGVLESGKTGSGTYLPMIFRTNGTQQCTLSTAGNMGCVSFSGIGTSLTSLNAANLLGAVPVANGGTGSTTFTTNALPYYNGSSLVSSVAQQSSSTIHITSNSVKIDTSGQGMVFDALSTGASITGTSSVIDMYVSGTTHVFQTSSSTGTCVYINGTGLRKMSLSGANFVDGGAC